MNRYPLARLALAVVLAPALGACFSNAPDEADQETHTTIEAGNKHGAVVVDSDGEIVITGDKTVQTRACTGQDVQVVGNANQATFTGRCGEATVMGADNRVSLENVTSISLIGSNNTVTWRGTKPEISNVGTGNRILKAE
ncbi:DUF3060 domain-containing protein [Hymenobacter persicinus]|uniref:DUF3060 domain-containing protein n=1 Tax=Hymenobacter persicinus TaxID=2025506 RepID=A0A4Q5LFG7_9BACT|nr:DUF3060 domain-containing protein [Hymenobacter persicinus]RYU81895.1 DUF3060 domain-containing protein [Hymenobacter persicinus]